MAEEVLKVTRNPNYAVLTLNRPEKRNALNQPLIDAINDALVKFENDKEIRALLLRGEGSSFCAGIDLKEVDEAESGHNPTSLESVFGRLERFPVPTIAAVQGAALADFTMISGFDFDITQAIANGAMVEVDPTGERPFIRVTRSSA